MIVCSKVKMDVLTAVEINKIYDAVLSRISSGKFSWYIRPLYTIFTSTEDIMTAPDLTGSLTFSVEYEKSRVTTVWKSHSEIRRVVWIIEKLRELSLVKITAARDTSYAKAPIDVYIDCDENKFTQERFNLDLSSLLPVVIGPCRPQPFSIEILGNEYHEHKNERHSIQFEGRLTQQLEPVINVCSRKV